MPVIYGQNVAEDHYQSVVHRIDVLAAMIRQRVGDKQYSNILANILPSRNGQMHFVDPMKDLGAIYDFVDQALDYVPDPDGFDVFFPPDLAMKYKQGDCDDQTILAGVLASTAGYPVKVRSIIYKVPGQFSHIYPLAGIRQPGGLIRWIPLDVTHRQGVGRAVEHLAAIDAAI